MINPDATNLASDVSFPEQSEITSKEGDQEIDDENMENSGRELESELEEDLEEIFESESGDISDDEVVDRPGLAFTENETSREQEYEQGN